MRYLIIIILAVLVVSKVQAQQITGQSYVQQTVMGVQKGFGVRAHLSGWGLGAVFQSTQLGSAEASPENYPMMALEGIIPITSGGKLNFSLTPKVGIVNEQFLVFIPEVETNIRINKLIYLGIGAGIRARQAATSLKLIIKAPKF